MDADGAGRGGPARGPAVGRHRPHPAPSPAPPAPAPPQPSDAPAAAAAAAAFEQGFCGPYFAADLAAPGAWRSPCAADAASAAVLLLFALGSLGLWAHASWAARGGGRRRRGGRRRGAGGIGGRGGGAGDGSGLRAPLLDDGAAAASSSSAAAGAAADAAERGRAAAAGALAAPSSSAAKPAAAPAAASSSITGVEATAVALCGALAVLHGAHLAASLALALPPSQQTYHAAAAACWLLCSRACLSSARRNAGMRGDASAAAAEVAAAVAAGGEEGEGGEEEGEDGEAAGGGGGGGAPGGALPPPPPPPPPLLPDLRPLAAAAVLVYAAQAAESLAIYARLVSVAARAAARAAAPAALAAASLLRSAGLAFLAPPTPPPSALVAFDGGGAFLPTGPPPSPLPATADKDPYPQAYVKVHVWSSALAAMLAICASLCRRRQRSDEAAASAARSQRLAKARAVRLAFRAAKLPPGCPLPPELAADGSGAAADREYTWPQLFAAAASYAWPDAPGLRLRVLVCALLLTVVRLLNLIVPLFYKRLVDALAQASSSTAAAAAAFAPAPSPGATGHGGGGGGGGGEPAHPADPNPATTSFMSLFAPWEALYLAALFFQGGSGGGIVGFLNNARSYVFIPVGQAAGRRAATAAFDHVLTELDLAWHLSRRTGEVTRVIDRGTGAVQNLLSTVVFSLGPQMIDVVAASFLLAGALQPAVAAVAFATVALYVPMTVAVTEWRSGFRRDLNARDNARGACVTDALLGWESVKLFTAEKRELGRYASATDAYITSERSFLSSLNALNVAQSSLMFAGVAGGLALCTAGVARGALTVGDVTLFLALLAQLAAPLNFFGTYFRMIAQYMVDTQSLFQLLAQKGSVRDAEGAGDLILPPPAPPGTPYASLPCVGVEFVGVTFGYPPGASAPATGGAGGQPGGGHGGGGGGGGRGGGGPGAGGPGPGGAGGAGLALAASTSPAVFHPPRTVLRDVSFAAPAGGTLALVGATGSGKSTVARLVFRFFDPWQGRILVAGQDVRLLRQRSLRAAIGMVAQDVALFNDTIRYNIRYARPTASDAEVEAAARAAQIHDAINSRFPRGYDTVVGERGLKLSGGEKQRVAIARAFLKAPPILVFGEISFFFFFFLPVPCGGPHRTAFPRNKRTNHQFSPPSPPPPKKPQQKRQQTRPPRPSTSTPSAPSSATSAAASTRAATTRAATAAGTAAARAATAERRSSSRTASLRSWTPTASSSCPMGAWPSAGRTTSWWPWERTRGCTRACGRARREGAAARGTGPRAAAETATAAETAETAAAPRRRRRQRRRRPLALLLRPPRLPPPPLPQRTGAERAGIVNPPPLFGFRRG